MADAATSNGTGRAWAIAARASLVAAVAAAVTQAVVLAIWAAEGKSDFGILYRHAVKINAGAAQVYARLDERTGWLYSVPPSGMVLFQLLACFPMVTAAIIWGAFNLLLLAGAVLCLAGVFRRLECRTEAFRGTLVWGASLLLLLACGSLQTGQFSVLFTACWAGYLLADSHRRHFLAGLALAVPAAAKFYPALLAAAPAVLGARRQLVFFCLALVVLLVGVTWAADGSGVWSLWDSYVRHMLLGDPGVVTPRIDPGVPVNQSIDVVLLRYLSYDPRFHDETPAFPHLDFSRRQVLILAGGIRAVILLISLVASWRWVGGGRQSPRYAALMMMALWSAALYLMLPDAKARYAVYVFPAFLPLLAAFTEAGAAGRGRRQAGLWLLCAMSAACLMGAMPVCLLNLGLGLLGPLALWVAVLVCMKRRPVRIAP